MGTQTGTMSLISLSSLLSKFQGYAGAALTRRPPKKTPPPLDNSPESILTQA